MYRKLTAEEFSKLVEEIEKFQDREWKKIRRREFFNRIFSFFHRKEEEESSTTE